MRISYLLFFISFSLLAQSPKLGVKINSITSIDNDSWKAEYHINYQIENKTNEELSFFLLPNALIAHAASSLTLYPVYKMYQNGVFEDMDGPFFEYETDDELAYAKIKDKTSDKAKELAKNFQTKQSNAAMDVYKKYKNEGGKSDDFQWVYYRQKLLDNIIVIQPNETKLFTIKTLWDKNRFIKNDDLEFYLDEKNRIEIELILDLKTNLFKDQLSEEDLIKINANRNFVKGEFVSNRVKIDFKE